MFILCPILLSLKCPSLQFEIKPLALCVESKLHLQGDSVKGSIEFDQAGTLLGHPDQGDLTIMQVSILAPVSQSTLQCQGSRVWRGMVLHRSNHRKTEISFITYSQQVLFPLFLILGI